jgi:hypothetical protein
MTIALFRQLAIQPALHLLPKQMSTPSAEAMLVTIGLQESRLAYRRQIGGPARSLFQFEVTGVAGVLTHQASSPLIHDVLSALSYPPNLWTPEECHKAIEHNDVLAAAFARCLLWTLPSALPKEDESHGAWLQYIKAWRPGRPHRATWDAFYEEGWQCAANRTGPPLRVGYYT